MPDGGFSSGSLKTSSDSGEDPAREEQVDELETEQAGKTPNPKGWTAVWGDGNSVASPEDEARGPGRPLRWERPSGTDASIPITVPVAPLGEESGPFCAGPVAS